MNEHQQTIKWSSARTHTQLNRARHPLTHNVYLARVGLLGFTLSLFLFSFNSLHWEKLPDKCMHKQKINRVSTNYHSGFFLLPACAVTNIWKYTNANANDRVRGNKLLHWQRRLSLFTAKYILRPALLIQWTRCSVEMFSSIFNR